MTFNWLPLVEVVCRTGMLATTGILALWKQQLDNLDQQCATEHTPVGLDPVNHQNEGTSTRILARPSS